MVIDDSASRTRPSFRVCGSVAGWLVIDIDVEDQRATVTQDASGLDQHLLGLLDMVEAVARQHHVNARGTERDLFGPDREIDSGRVRQQEIVRRVLLCERPDTDADPGRTRVGKSKWARSDVHDDLAVEEVTVLDRRLPQHATHLGSCLLPPSTEVVGSRLLAIQQLQRIAGKEAAGAQHGIPLLQPPAQLRLLLDRDRVAESGTQAKPATDARENLHARGA